MAKRVKSPEPVTDEVSSAISALLAAASEPLTVAAVVNGLRGPLKRKPDQIEQFLRAQATGLDGDLRSTSGMVREYSPVKAKARFGDREPIAYIRLAILKDLQKSKTPQEPKSLLKKVSKLFPGATSAEVDEVLSAAVLAGEAHIHPPLAGRDLKKVKYSSRPAVVEAYLKKAWKELLAASERLAPAGVSREQAFDALARLSGLRAAEPPSFRPATTATKPDAGDVAQVGERILAVLPRVEPAAGSGALVFFQDLRRAPELAELTKPAFDAAVLALNTSRPDVVLHHHDHAPRLSDAERNQLVADDQGHYYVGMAFRR